MKKNILIAIMSIFTLMFSLQNINALELKQNNSYTNLNNITMTDNQINNLKNLGFTDAQIENMDQEEFDNNKNLSGEVVSQITKYYKTTVFHPNLDSDMFSINSVSNLPTSITVEISENEYANSNLDTAISTNGLSNGYTETEYKKMTTTIIKNGSYYRYKNDVVWKKMPANRSYDIIGIGIDSTVSGISSSKYFKMTYRMDNSEKKACYNYSSSNAIWSLSSTGYGATFKLPANTKVETLDELSSYMYFDVQKLATYTLQTINAYGDYKHSQKQVDQTVTGGITVGTSGINIDANVSTSVREAFDNMTTAQATLSGIAW